MKDNSILCSKMENNEIKSYWVIPGLTPIKKDNKAYSSLVIEKIEKKIQSTLKEKNRKRKIVEGRQIMCYKLRKETDMSLKEIGNLINKDHATVLYSSKHIEDILKVDKKFEKEWEEILNL